MTLWWSEWAGGAAAGRCAGSCESHALTESLYFRHCIVFRPFVAVVAPRLPVGSRVRLAPGRPSGDKLRTDEIGVLVTDDNSDRPYEVRVGVAALASDCLGPDTCVHFHVGPVSEGQRQGLVHGKRAGLGLGTADSQTRTMEA